MTDPLRTDRSPATGDVPDRDRDARIEELLLLGLDHYFGDRYELAISVWTRVLFLDRGHARARAYIERARSAIAERQREGEELVHTAVAAFDRGDTRTARRLLTMAVDRGTAADEALAALDRVNRFDQPAPGASPSAPRGSAPTRRDGGLAGSTRRGVPRVAWIAAGALAGLAVAAAAAWLWTSDASWLSLNQVPARPEAARIDEELLPVPTAAEVSLARARSLRDRGRLHEALDVLDAIRRGDPVRRRADELRAAIQDELLASARGAPAASRPTPKASPQ